MSLLTMTELNLAGKRVLIRQDLNVPIVAGKITSMARIDAALPTLEQALKAGAKVMVMSHLGRPNEGEYNQAYSLAPLAVELSRRLGQEVELVHDWHEEEIELADGQLVLLENVRFNEGEKQDDPQLAKQLASLCDIYVMDAFATAHRAQASTHGVGLYAPVACAGPLLIKELDALAKALAKPEKPVLAIVGGAKVSSKLQVLKALAKKVDQLIVGGGIANTFLAAAGFKVGKSLYEKDLLDEASELMVATHIPLATDVVVAHSFSADAEARIKPVAEVTSDDMILDLGPQSCQQMTDLIAQAKTIIWNGPIGAFEYDQFAEGTKTIAQAVAANQGFSIAGGGDTLAAIGEYGITDKLSYISTGGGAFLEFVEGKKLPAVAMLEKRANSG
jgi:phosphoglycerate kinase